MESLVPLTHQTHIQLAINKTAFPRVGPIKVIATFKGLLRTLRLCLLLLLLLGMVGGRAEEGRRGPLIPRK